jgi:hypothetical protein
VKGKLWLVAQQMRNNQVIIAALAIVPR